MRYRIISILALAIVLADQLTKWLIVTTFPLHTERVVTSFFSLVHVRNRGAAFGFLNNPDISWQFWLFTAATILALAIIMGIAKKAQEHETRLFIALGCIVGGAIGNFIDRVRLRAVIDFLDLHWQGWHWPAFNVADIAICIGAMLIGAIVLFPNLAGRPQSSD